MAQSEKLFYYSFLLVGISLLLGGIIYAMSLLFTSSSLIPSLTWILTIVQIIAGIVALIAVAKLFKEYG